MTYLNDSERASGLGTDRSPWLNRFAMIVVLATFLLILAGGNVTSRGAGLAVPDWPLSFGSVNPDGWTSDMGGQQPGVRAEHGHRLIGATVGMLVTVLAVWLWCTDRRGWVRGLGVAAFVAVVIQGLMGGLRVTEQSTALAIVHGCFAQAFFVLLIVLATVTSRRWPDRLAGIGGDTDRLLRFWTLLLPMAFYAQTVLGAIYRHTGSGVMWHIGGALVVGMVLMQASQQIFRRPIERDGGLSRLTIILFVLLGLQIVLGVMAFVLVSPVHSEGLMRSLANMAAAVVPTIHVGMGSILLGLSAYLALRARVTTDSEIVAAPGAEALGGVPA